MTVFLTVFSGVMTFVLGEMIIKLFIEPVHDFRRTISEVALTLIEYANVYTNPGETKGEVEKKAAEEIRRLSSRLNAQIYLIPYYQITSKIFCLPSRSEATNATKNLIGLSNGIFSLASDSASVNLERAKRIRKSLGIFIDEE